MSSTGTGLNVPTVSNVIHRMTTAVVDFNGVVPEKMGGLGSVSANVIRLRLSVQHCEAVSPSRSRVRACAIERYGLRFFEAYVQPIADVRTRNAFQSCFPVPLALPPPHVLRLAARVPEGIPGGERHYFECALLRRMGFVLDCEPPEAYPDAVDVVYSYRSAPFRYAQYVHRDGVAFAQVLSGTDGFLFLTNRLIAPGRAGLGPGMGRKPHAAAAELRISMQKFCENVEALSTFYEEEIALLRKDVEEDPPELNI